MSLRSGSSTRVVLWKESAFNADPVLPVCHQIPWADDSPSLGFRQSEGNVREMIPNLQRVKAPRGFTETGGGLVVPVEDTLSGMLLLGLLPDYTYAAGAPATHTFQPGLSTPFTFGAEIGDEVAAKYDQFTGLAVNSLDLDLAPKPEHAHISWGFVGGGRVFAYDAAELDAAPAVYENPRFQVQDGLIKVDGSTASMILSGRLSLRREVTMYRTTEGLGYGSEVCFGGYEVRVTLQALFDSASTIRALGTGEGEFSLEFNLPHPSSVGVYLKFTMGLCQGFITATNYNGRRAVEVTADVSAFYTSGNPYMIAGELKCTATDLETLWVT